MSNKMRRILMGILLCVFCFSAFQLGKYYLEYKQGNDIYETAKTFVVEAGEMERPQRYTQIDFNGLQKINEEVFGWMKIEDTPVDYPLLQASNNEYYLNRTYDHQWSDFGSIFLDYKNKNDLTDKHSIFYGHNMVNDSMFGSLMSYKNEEFAEEHNLIYIMRPNEDLVYRIFSVYRAKIDDSTYNIGFADDASYQRMIDHMVSSSVVQMGVVPTIEDKILTLSTCTPAGEVNYRFVVNAVLLDQEEVKALEQETQ